jgi:hypothetical protein
MKVLAMKVHPKVVASTGAGGTAAVVTLVLALAGVRVSGDVASAVTTIVSFVAGYVKSA